MSDIYDFLVDHYSHVQTYRYDDNSSTEKYGKLSTIDETSRFDTEVFYFQRSENAFSSYERDRSKDYPVLVTERWARCTGSQPSGDFKPSTRR